MTVASLATLHVCSSEMPPGLNREVIVIGVFLSLKSEAKRGSGNGANDTNLGLSIFRT